MPSNPPTSEEVNQAIHDLREGFDCLNDLIESQRQRIIELEEHIKKAGAAMGKILSEYNIARPGPGHKFVATEHIWDGGESCH